MTQLLDFKKPPNEKKKLCNRGAGDESESLSHHLSVIYEKHTLFVASLLQTLCIPAEYCGLKTVT